MAVTREMAVKQCAAGRHCWHGPVGISQALCCWCGTTRTATKNECLTDMTECSHEHGGFVEHEEAA